MEGILSALITGGLALIGVVVSNSSTRCKIQQELRITQAVTDTKIEELTREVREHNHFAQRVPVLEEQVKVINHRLSNLEGFHKPQG